MRLKSARCHGLGCAGADAAAAAGLAAAPSGRGAEAAPWASEPPPTSDKDANGATVMFCEVAAYAKARGLTLDALLDEVYAEYGFYLEQNGNLVFEGAEGAAKIKRLAESYVTQPPQTLDGAAVTEVTNFATQEIRDVEGDLIPKEAMLILALADGRRVAVRPSGTEPKIKFYLFGRREPAPGQTFTREELGSIKGEVKASLERLWAELQADVDRRLA